MNKTKWIYIAVLILLVVTSRVLIDQFYKIQISSDANTNSEEISDSNQKPETTANDTEINSHPTSEATTANTSDSEPLLPFGQITRDDAIKHIEWAYQNNVPYDQFSVATKEEAEYVVSYYQIHSISQTGEILNDEKGLLFFQIINSKPELVWELEHIPSYIRPTNSIGDMTGDGYSEIASKWSNGKYEGLYVISFDPIKKTFKLISPMSKSGLLSAFTAPDGTMALIDLDRDSLPEVTFPRSSNTHIDPNTGDALSDTVYVAYKWNGTEYILWKEQDEPFTDTTQ